MIIIKYFLKYIPIKNLSQILFEKYLSTTQTHLKDVFFTTLIIVSAHDKIQKNNCLFYFIIITITTPYTFILNVYHTNH